MPIQVPIAICRIAILKQEAVGDYTTQARSQDLYRRPLRSTCSQFEERCGVFLVTTLSVR